MHEQLLDVGAMRLVGRRIQSELDCSDDMAVEPCRQQYSIARSDRMFDLAKECQRLIVRKWRQEADAGAAVDAIDQHISQLRQFRILQRRIENIDVWLDAHA